jgi:hypothetical protein
MHWWIWALKLTILAVASFAGNAQDANWLKKPLGNSPPARDGHSPAHSDEADNDSDLMPIGIPG